MLLSNCIGGAIGALVSRKVTSFERCSESGDGDGYAFAPIEQKNRGYARRVSHFLGRPKDRRETIEPFHQVL